MYWKNKSIITGLPIEMSIWANIHRRSNGIQYRKEDKYLRIIESIETKLKSLKVGPGLNHLLRMFILVVKDKDTGEYKITSLLCESIFHPDGSRDYCSNQNISNILKTIGDDELITIH